MAQSWDKQWQAPQAVADTTRSNSSSSSLHSKEQENAMGQSLKIQTDMLALKATSSFTHRQLAPQCASQCCHLQVIGMFSNSIGSDIATQQLTDSLPHSAPASAAICRCHALIQRQQAGPVPLNEARAKIQASIVQHLPTNPIFCCPCAN
jgi:hypothetical protein